MQENNQLENPNKERITIKGNQLSRSSSGKMESLSYLQREKLSYLKRKLCEKVFRDLSNKYYNLIRDKSYDINNFTKEFEKEMEKSYDFNNPDYKIFFRKIENIFLNKMFYLEDKNGFNDCAINDRNSKEKIEKANKKNMSQTGFSFGKGYSIRNLDQYHIECENIKNPTKIVFSSLKKDNLKKRQTEDEWAKIAEKDYKKFLQENEIEKKKAYEKKVQYSQVLESQIKEKENSKKQEIEKDRKYYEEVFLKDLQKMENEEKLKKQNYRQKIIENKQASMKEFKGDKN